MSILKAAELLRNSKSTTILSGAGISTPSGIPDFRSNKNGLWNKVDPMEVASLTAFRLQPEKFFSFIKPLVGDILKAEPNPAHSALAQLEDAGYIRAIITQNIDGLHQKAGSKNVYEIHGTFSTLTCVSCFKQYKTAQFTDMLLDLSKIPTCPDCGSILKPDAILFGEQLPVQVWQDSEKAARACELMFVLGSSLEVVPVAGLPILALNNGAKLIVINESPTYIDQRADVVLNQDVAVALPEIAKYVTRN
ncbi:MAG: NAD-dependent deacylase [Chloroflexi bacterium]|nr:NAD-dependent deacylase [Chloroflexota bacterium]